MSTRAPKQWSLSKTENITTFEAWRQNLLYILSLDSNFADFLSETFTWEKKTPIFPTRGLSNDPPEQTNSRTAQQKMIHLELMLGQIANYCPIISRNIIVRQSTSLSFIWQAIRLHFGIQSSGAQFLDYAAIKLDPDERPEDLFQRLLAFTDDNLLKAGGPMTHHGAFLDTDEEISPTLENMIVLDWLRLIHPNLPALVKQRYGTELRSRTLASIRPEISQALQSMLDELQTAADARVLRASGFNNMRPKAFSRSSTKPKKSCPLCLASGRQSNHFLTKCEFLPPNDRAYLAKLRLTSCHDEDEDLLSEPEDDFCTLDIQDNPPPTSVRTSIRHVGTGKSPFFSAYYQQHTVTITVDSGGETNMMKTSTARRLGLSIKPKTSQRAFQADGITPLPAIGETHITLTRGDIRLKLDALVVDKLDVEILAGIPFMTLNDVAVRPSRSLITIQDHEYINYSSPSTKSNPVIRSISAQVLRCPASITVWPGDFLELEVPPEFPPDSEVAVECRTDNARNQHMSKQRQQWPQPQIADTVGTSLRITNSSDEPLVIRRHEQICHVRPTMSADTDDYGSAPSQQPASPTSRTGPWSTAVRIDPDSILEPEFRRRFRQLVDKFDHVFDPTIVGYNGAAGEFKAVVNMGPVLPPQRKGRLPQYSRDRLTELQDQFDELERASVFRKPEEVGISVEYLNPSFLVKKPSGGFRLVTAFADVGRYSKPQPSLMPDVDSTLRSIAQWKYIIVSDLTRAFFQIPLAKDSMKFCGVVTPFRGIRVYTRCAMGMPGSETALEELMCRVLGDFIKDGFVTKLADDLFCGGNSPQELLANWSRVLEALSKCNLRLSASKTIICPQSTTILGWIWSQGQLSASPHRIATLSTCSYPETVRQLRSFIGAYKVLSRVIRNCSSYLEPLDNSICGLQSSDKIPWTDDLRTLFADAQKALLSHKCITLPRPSDTLWIVTDGSVTRRGIAATLYVTRGEKRHLAGFFSAKLRAHQVQWLPCEIEALCIGAAVKHFSPYLIQSTQPACVLTDSKPCVQAISKLYRGEFSASPRITSFLSIVSRYQVSVRHLAGVANLPSDFGSRNAQECPEASCQVCQFLQELESSVVRFTSSADSTHPIAYASRSAWLSVQQTCSDLRRVHAHLSQGTRPSKKDTNIKDVKRYLNIATIASDGLLVVKSNQPFITGSEQIIVPRNVADGLLTALHLKYDHPSRHQLKLIVGRRFYILDLPSLIERTSSSCHTCTSLSTLPVVNQQQSTSDPPYVVGQTFAADILKRSRQLILVIRECVTSFTSACIVPDERRDSLRDGLITLLVGLRPLDGPRAIVRLDPAPGFVSLSHDDALSHYGISIEIGRVKNVNKNPVAEKAIAELEHEIRRQDPSGGPLSSAALAVCIARLNTRIRSQGLSSRELWTQRSQFTGDQLPICDQEYIFHQNLSRRTNHPYSEKAKRHGAPALDCLNISVGDLVYLRTDRDKTKARSRYLVVSVDGEWCLIKKFTGNQLRACSYKVKLSDCFLVPHTKEPDTQRSPDRVPIDDDDPTDSSHIVDAPTSSALDSVETSLYQPSQTPTENNSTPPCQPPETPLEISSPLTVLPENPTLPTDDLLTPAQTPPDVSTEPRVVDGYRRPRRTRRPPSYLKDYDMS